MRQIQTLIFFGLLCCICKPAEAAYVISTDHLGAKITLDLEAGGDDRVTDREVQEFLGALTSRTVKARVWLYHAESVEEVRSALTLAHEYSEGELSSFLWGRLKAVPRACMTGAALAAAYLCTNYALTHYSDKLPSLLEPSVPGLMTTLSISFLTPILQPMIATATKSAFRAFKSNKATTSSVTSEKLNLIWYATSGRLSMNEEMARNTFMQAYNTIQVSLSGVGTDLIHLRQPYSFLVERIAETVRVFANLYVDIGPRDLGLDLMVKSRITVYQNQEWFRPEFLQDIEQRIKDIDPLGYQSKDQKKRYLDILSAWIGEPHHPEHTTIPSLDEKSRTDLTQPLLSSQTETTQ